jgi:cation diffusion facilitator family transporter
MKVTVGLYGVVFAAKLSVYFLTGVMALLGEALHTLSDIFISAFLLVAIIWSGKKANEVHMFGFGRSQNVAALVAATLFISFTAYKLFEEAIPRLFRPQEPSYQNLGLAVGVIVASMLIAAAPMIGLLRQKKRGAAAKAQLVELINDELGLIAALIGTMFIIWGYPIGDPIATIVVATIIAVNAAGLFRENLSFLLGKSPGPEFIEMVKRTALSVDGVVGVHELRAEYVGPDAVHVGMHIEVRADLTVQEAAGIAEEVERQVHQRTGSGYCVIHVDAARDDTTPVERAIA